jgi:hypothetical protein
MAEIYKVTPEEIARRRKRILTPPDPTVLEEIRKARCEWLRLHGKDKPAPPLWEKLKIPKLRVVDPWE